MLFRSVCLAAVNSSMKVGKFSTTPLRRMIQLPRPRSRSILPDKVHARHLLLGRAVRVLVPEPEVCTSRRVEKSEKSVDGREAQGERERGGACRDVDTESFGEPALQREPCEG